MILEILGYIAALLALLRVDERGWPVGRIGGAGLDIGWDRRAREEPDLDKSGCYLCGVDAALDAVEGGAEGVGWTGVAAAPA